MNKHNIEIWDEITPQKGTELCEYFGFNTLADEISNNLHKYNIFKFDGYCGIPDNLIGLLNCCDIDKITYDCCLPVSLLYSYGCIDSEYIDFIFLTLLVSRGKLNYNIADLLIKAKNRCVDGWSQNFIWKSACKGGV